LFPPAAKSSSFKPQWLFLQGLIWVAFPFPPLKLGPRNFFSPSMFSFFLCSVLKLSPDSHQAYLPPCSPSLKNGSLSAAPPHCWAHSPPFQRLFESEVILPISVLRIPSVVGGRFTNPLCPRSFTIRRPQPCPPRYGSTHETFLLSSAMTFRLPSSKAPEMYPKIWRSLPPGEQLLPFLSTSPNFLFQASYPATPPFPNLKRERPIQLSSFFVESLL